mmetsp:Transcript_32913/g.83370  ORF Transcript_32913/g.83370 Transcript_32913/m.83370 type:complete len:139 (+) Transcript_32913:1780-2196(+)
MIGQGVVAAEEVTVVVVAEVAVDAKVVARAAATVVMEAMEAVIAWSGSRQAVQSSAVSDLDLSSNHAQSRCQESRVTVRTPDSARTAQDDRTRLVALAHAMIGSSLRVQMATTIGAAEIRQRLHRPACDLPWCACGKL